MNTQNENQTDAGLDPVLRITDLVQALGTTEASIRAAIKKNKFPRGFRLFEGGRVVVWRRSDVEAFLNERQQSANIKK